eukprot:sb/3476140/
MYKRGWLNYSNQKQCCRELSGEHFGCNIDIPSLINRQINRLLSKIRVHEIRAGFTFGKMAKLLGSHCIPHKSCRKLSGGHFGTRVFVLAQCSLESSEVHFDTMILSFAFRLSCVMTVGT